jgi:Cu/Ag efflux protein CusF
MSAINFSSRIRLFARDPDPRANPSRIWIRRLLGTSRVSLRALAISAAVLAPAHVASRPLDAPSISLDASQQVLTSQIDGLNPALAIRARPQETLRGVVAEVDQRHDRITVRLTPGATADFKVQDGLLFNSIRYGDEVELTVETIDGEKTIVGLRKE